MLFRAMRHRSVEPEPRRGWVGPFFASRCAPLAGFLVPLLPSCGGSPPAPQAPALARSAAPAPPPAPDLSAVPEPPHLVVYARLAKPSASLATVHAWSKLPMPGAEQVTELVANEPLGPLVDLDRPIDVAIAAGGTSRMPQAALAISAPLKDPEQARALLAERYKLVPGDNGVSLIQGLGHSSGKAEADDEDDDKGGAGGDRACEIAPAYGDAPVRLVCGMDARSLMQLGPWLTRTAPRTATTSDLHVDVQMAPVRAIVAEQKRFLGVLLSSVLGGRSGPTAGRELAVSVATDMADFATDLDTVAFDMALGDGGADATATLKLATASSVVGRLATAHADRSGPAPDAFWQLPSDADFAVFHRGLDDGDLTPLRDLVLKAIDDELAAVNVKDADRKAVLDALAKVASPSAKSYASGLDLAAVKKALAAEKAVAGGPDSPERLEARRVAAEVLLGWRLLEVEEPATRATGVLKEIAAAWAGPGIAAAYRARNKGAAAPVLRAVAVSKGASLPAGSVHYLLELPPLEEARGGAGAGKAKADDKDKAKQPVAPPKRFAIHAFVVPDGARTWIAFAGDEALATSKLAMALGAGQAKLSSRAELARLKSGPVGAGGFFTLRGLAETATLSAILSGGSLRGTAEGLDEATQMPGQGMVAIPFSLTAQPGSPPASQVTLQVPRGAIEDVVTALRVP